MKKLFLIMTALFVFLTGCSSKQDETAKVKPIGIIGAMDSEVTTLKAALEDVKVTKKAGLEFHAGKLNGKDVVVVQSGIGKVNAASCTQILADEFNVSHVINTGVAGGLYKELQVGDVVISTRAVEHDMDVRAFGHKKGYIPGMGEEGEPTYFETDKALGEKALEVANEVLEGNKAYMGTIASGDIFVSDQKIKEELVAAHDAYAAEMEGAAIAHVASLNGIPTTIIRAISDLASGEANVTYEEFEVKAAKDSANIVMNLVKKM
ncbi:MAG: 5'-methylthioadenosine/adenosylhomocysteine nucleosidase [Bacillaceae bacterium]